MLNKIADLHKICFPHKPWDANEFASLQKSGAKIIASDNGFIVWRVVLDECEIITIGVHPNYRGTGIGDALMQLMERDITGVAKKIFLEVASDNDAAIGLYKKHGFARIGSRPKYYDGIDAIIMEKALP